MPSRIRSSAARSCLRAIFAVTCVPTCRDMSKQRSRSSENQLETHSSTSGAGLREPRSVGHRLNNILPTRSHLHESFDASFWMREEAVHLIEEKDLLWVVDCLLKLQDFGLCRDRRPRPVIQLSLPEKSLWHVYRGMMRPGDKLVRDGDDRIDVISSCQIQIFCNLFGIEAGVTDFRLDQSGPDRSRRVERSGAHRADILSRVLA